MTASAHLKIVADNQKYTVKGAPAGEILFKILMQNSVINARYTKPHLRENMTNLEAYTANVNSNIETFNQHVKVDA